jgi:hypothetical protein
LEHYWSTFGAIEVPDRSQNLTVKFNPTQQNKFRSPHCFGFIQRNRDLTF